MTVCDCLEVRQVLPEGAILDGGDQLFWCFPNRRPKVVRRNLAVRSDWTRRIRNLRNGVFASPRYHGNGKNPTQNNTVKKAGTFHLGASLSSWLQQTSCVSVVHPVAVTHVLSTAGNLGKVPRKAYATRFDGSDQ
jgi:hypothetical protein